MGKEEGGMSSTSRTATLKQVSSRAKAHRLSVLKHRKQAEEVAGMIALRAVVLGAQWSR